MNWNDIRKRLERAESLVSALDARVSVIEVLIGEGRPVLQQRLAELKAALRPDGPGIDLGNPPEGISER
jgi:hypothetical protein